MKHRPRRKVLRVSESPLQSGSNRRGAKLRASELLIVLPLFLWLGTMLSHNREFLDWRIIVWAAAVAIVDLLPIQGSSEMAFSLSFPIELSAALVFSPAVAAMIAFLGAADRRELRRELPPLKALYIRGQIAWSVALESAVFHQLASLEQSRWYQLAPAVLTAALAGYALNTLVVAGYASLQSGTPLKQVLRDMHVGVFGEFVVSYMGLALFSVLVALSTETTGLWALVVFIAPLAFARQMFQRTHSLQQATEDLAERQAENEYQALHDALTGMPNRMLFQQQLAEAIHEAGRLSGSMAVMLMDLDHFKEVNDTLGHHFGDQLLKQIGPRLSTVLRDNDLMARLGGDEFGILLPDLPDRGVAVRIAERLLEEFERPVTVEGLALDVSGSIGIAIFPEQSDEAEALLRRADVAMYAAKESGGGYEVYDEFMDEHHPARLTLIGQVRPAIENSEFIVYYQPKVRLSDGRVSGAEALVRWDHPERGIVPPDEFIPFVEKTVLLRPLTLYVFGQVMRQWRAWADEGIKLPIAVNLSPRSLLDGQLPDQISELLDRWSMPAGFLKVELTENFMMAESGRSTGVIDRLNDIGVSLSIDDFGTGYSSLSHLKRLPIDEIKIDRSFVMHMHEDANDFMIVRATVELGRNLGLRVVAEGVEDLETFDRLADFGCDEAQGFFISRPISAADFTRWLTVRGPEAIVYYDVQGDRQTSDGGEPSRGRLHVV
jgi:diguanylate cyclase (GGDEF)-like protein